ncbi:MAG: pyrroline-5-carboxylate reductase [Acidiferrobacter sp.]
MTDPSIGIIGAGNMGLALASGLVAASVPRGRLAISDPNPDKRHAAERLGITTEPDNDALVRRTDVLVLAVKPQHLQVLCRAIAPAVAVRRPLVISVAAGVRAADINRWLGGELAVVRAMPNTPALIRAGASVMFANERATKTDRQAAESVLKAVSEVFWVADESLMDAVTAVSGSGPAYLFLFLEALIAAGIAAGLPRDLCAALAKDTALGAARMAKTSPDDVALLRTRVTSPGGTTEQAIKSFLDSGFMEMFTRAILAAATRSQQLGDQLGAL